MNQRSEQGISTSTIRDTAVSATVEAKVRKDQSIRKIVDSNLPMVRRLALVALTTGILGAVTERAALAKQYSRESAPFTSVEQQHSKQRDIKNEKISHEKQKEKFQLLLENPAEVMNMVEKQGLILRGNLLETRDDIIHFDTEINGVVTDRVLLNALNEKTLEVKTYNSDGTIDTVRIQEGSIVSAVTTRE